MAKAAAQQPSCKQLADWDSPYMGHTGTPDGKGAEFLPGHSIVDDLNIEAAEGMHWTQQPVHWKKWEQDGPTNWDHDVTGAWASMDQFVIEAQKRALNPMFQVTIGGNADKPPDWAGQRQSGASAPANMDALIDFVAKLGARYRPGGSLALSQGWGTCFGVRAWEMDNEPSSYETNWGNEAGDYAEFVDRAGQKLHALDPKALVVAPAIANGQAKPNGTTPNWVDSILDPNTANASAPYLAAGQHHSAGPQTDVVSFHIYEGVPGAPFDGLSPLVEDAFHQIKAVFDNPAHMNAAGFSYLQKQHYWCTECASEYGATLVVPNGVDQDPYANWVGQWMTRTLAAGVEKLTVMDPSPQQQKAVSVYTTLLPRPTGMREVTAALGYDPAAVRVFQWTAPRGGRRVYVAWQAPSCTAPLATCQLNTGHQVRIPVQGAHPQQVDQYGTTSDLEPQGGAVTVALGTGVRWNPITYVIDDPHT
jgi:hypothetical protein